MFATKVATGKQDRFGVCGYLQVEFRLINFRNCNHQLIYIKNKWSGERIQSTRNTNIKIIIVN